MEKTKAENRDLKLQLENLRTKLELESQINQTKQNAVELENSRLQDMVQDLNQRFTERSTLASQRVSMGVNNLMNTRETQQSVTKNQFENLKVDPRHGRDT